MTTESFADCAQSAREIITADRDCSACGGSGTLEDDGTEHAACGLCEGSGKVHVYGPNVRELAKGFLTYARRPRS